MTTVASKNLVRRWGAGTAAIVRFLVAADAPVTGVALAHAVGVTQPRASQVLKQLAALDVVRVTEDGYIGRRPRLIDLYGRRARPLLADPETHWYSTTPMSEQGHRIRELADGLGTAVAFSADLGPDLLAPWRHPTLTIVYATDQLTVETVRFVPAEGRADASLILRRTTDRTLLSPAGDWPASVGDIPLTDPLQQWWDLLDLGGEDRREAADRLRRAILDRTLATTTSR